MQGQGSRKLRGVVLASCAWILGMWDPSGAEDELPCDRMIRVQIDGPLDSDLLKLDVIGANAGGGVRGEFISFSILPEPGSPDGFSPAWRVIDRTGQPWHAGWFCGGGVVGPLSASDGPYQIEVRDWEQTHSGQFLVHMQRLTQEAICDEIHLGCDKTIAVAIDGPLDSDLVWFTAADQETVRFSIIPAQASPDGFSPAWRVIDRLGQPWHAGWFNGSADVGPLPIESGPYRIEIRAWDQIAAGKFLIHIQKRWCPPEFIRGDTDGNGLYTLGDGIQILERLFAGRTAFSCGCDACGDLDDDGHLVLGDAILVFMHLFAGGGRPALPAYHCGPDPTPDTLTCRESTPPCR